MHHSANYGERSVLAALRALIPARPLELGEALTIAEVQANRLLLLTGITDGPVPSHVVSGLPRVRLVYSELPASGLSYWDGRQRSWIIHLNSAEPRTRQRLTSLHEYKHIIDHGAADRLYRDTAHISAQEQAERTADYFAGCVLVPKWLLRRAWGLGLQRADVLAKHFDISTRAMNVRLVQTGKQPPRTEAASVPPIRPNRRPSGRTHYHQPSVLHRRPCAMANQIREVCDVRT